MLQAQVADSTSEALLTCRSSRVATPGHEPPTCCGSWSRMLAACATAGGMQI